MNIAEYQNILVVLVCLSLGYIIKHLIPAKKINKFIPLINGIVGVGIAWWIKAIISPEILVTGLISGLSSTGLYEVFKNLIEGKNGTN